MVLVDVTPSQDMLDEGVAREVINKIQKLRKKVKEVVCVYFCILYTSPLNLPPSPLPSRLVCSPKIQ